MGVSLSLLLFTYTGASVARTFFVTAAAFGALSLYGYTTKRDLTAMGKFLFMGVIGLILAGLVNMIWPSGTMSFIISAAGVLIFSGLIAYDTQKIKEQYAEAWGTEMAEKVSHLRRAQALPELRQLVPIPDDVYGPEALVPLRQT
jgi:FtsH-binding integral membrane protein